MPLPHAPLQKWEKQESSGNAGLECHLMYPRLAFNSGESSYSKPPLHSPPSPFYYLDRAMLSCQG